MVTQIREFALITRVDSLDDSFNKTLIGKFFIEGSRFIWRENPNFEKLKLKKRFFINTTLHKNLIRRIFDFNLSPTKRLEFQCVLLTDFKLVVVESLGPADLASKLLIRPLSSDLSVKNLARGNWLKEQFRRLSAL